MGRKRKNNGNNTQNSSDFLTGFSSVADSTKRVTDESEIINSIDGDEPVLTTETSMKFKGFDDEIKAADSDLITSDRTDDKSDVVSSVSKKGMSSKDDLKSLADALVAKTEALEDEMDVQIEPKVKDVVQTQPLISRIPENMKLTEEFKKSNNSSIITAPEHIVKKDDNFHKRKIIRYGIIAGASIISLLLLFMIVRSFNSLEVPDFTNSTINEANVWAVTNGISLDRDEEYSLEFDEGIIMDQGRRAGSRISRGSVLRVGVSLGPDMDEVIELPDFSEMTTTQVRNWRQELQVLSVSVREEYDDEIEANHFIRMEVPQGVDADYFRRSNSLSIYMSRGMETFQVVNFSDRTREDVEGWATENEVTVVFEYETNEDIPRDTVITQSVRPGERITSNDTLTITLSGGVPIVVPNFNNLTHEEAAEIPGLMVSRRDRFHATIPFGRVVSQSVASGTELFDDAVVTVVYSLGQPFMDDLRGTSEGDLGRIFFDFNSRGANITYTTTTVSSDAPRGTVVWMSRYGQHIGMTDHINIHISRGDLESTVGPSPTENLELDVPSLIDADDVLEDSE